MAHRTESTDPDITLTSTNELPRGILRNGPPKNSYNTIPGKNKFDRKQVLVNTKQNAKLHDMGKNIVIDKKYDNLTEEEKKNLKWDEVKLAEADQERSATMKIDEPKTPYQGPAGMSEYYDDADEQEDTADIEDFTLGEPEVPSEVDDTAENYRIIKTDDDSGDDDSGDEQDDEQQTQQIDAEEKKRKFEQMRKAHYRLKGNILKQPLPAVDDDDE